MIRYILDTNTVSHLLKGHPAVARWLIAVPMASLCISAITEGELLFGLAKRPAAKQQHITVREFLKRVGYHGTQRCGRALWDCTSQNGGSGKGVVVP